MLPSAGPVASEVVSAGQAENKVLFDIVEVNNRVVSALLTQPRESFHARFEKGLQPPELKIAIGDTLSVTIWESAAGGLFSEAPPPQLPSGSRQGTEPLAPEAPRPPTETTPEPIPGIDQLFGTQNPSPGASLGTPPPQGGRAPSGNVRQTGPPSMDAISATVDRRSATIPDQQVARMARSVSLMPAGFRPPGERQRKYSKQLRHCSQARLSSLRRW